ncbi:hypothetical protein [Methylobacterium indicum]|uniref:hypothetical protein n=1 Tax=Methylobacterium indicum TaxID=1775910 RepID=UPI0009E39D5F|nr:hypothetical protein [Methylobacterium indicum]
MTNIPSIFPPAIWDSETILIKAQRYVEEMLKCDRDDWKFAFWSSLTIELLARAVLAKVSPTLLADPEDWNNLYHALGYTPTAPKFSPKSISISDVLNRIRDIHPDKFEDDLRKWCAGHTGKRNAELHSGEMPFEGLKSSTWLPSFYRACSSLMSCLGKDLADLIGQREAKLAEKLIAAAKDQAAKAVAGLIKSHKTVWDGKGSKEKKKLEEQAEVWAGRYDGHVVDCPSCNSKSLLTGEPISIPTKTIEEDTIKETQQYIPSKFECVACGLKIVGLPQLTACSLSDTYKKTSYYDAAEYYAPDAGFEDYADDNNEPL